MGGFGAISGMISSIKENRKLANSRKTAKENKDLYIGKFDKNHTPLIFEDKMSKAEHDELRIKLEKRKKNSTTLLIITIFIICALTVGFVYYLMNL